tara:strand:- start:352 stop:969 length:618 start_codon:yes stop_codon:yes gene_type:complete
MIRIVDYGLGNINAFLNIYEALDIPAAAARTSEDLRDSLQIILPGVGAFDWAMTRLNDSGMRETLDELVLERKKPVLGVCVGMQMMAQSSDEGDLGGLGWLDARVLGFNFSNDPTTPLPHMGWNDVEPASDCSLFSGINDPTFYFLHSFFIEPTDRRDIASVTDYGGRFVSAVHHDNVYGTQFHPEKSHHWGVALLRNFAAVATC